MPVLVESRVTGGHEEQVAMRHNFSEKKRLIWTMWDHHFGRETAEKRLDLNIYTCRMMVQKFRRLLSELLGHRLARADIEIEPFSSRFSPKTTDI